MNHLEMKPKFVYMRAGFYEEESLKEIIDRKRREIADTGYAFWGYSGSACNPRTQVQPFAEEASKNGEPVYLFVSETESKNRPSQSRENNLYSIDMINWRRTPETIRVQNADYALVIKSLDEADFVLPLNKTVVAVDGQEGKRGSSCLKGRTESACLTLADDYDEFAMLDLARQRFNETIILVAELCSPYAVFLNELQNEPQPFALD